MCAATGAPKRKISMYYWCRASFQELSYCAGERSKKEPHQIGNKKKQDCLTVDELSLIF